MQTENRFFDDLARLMSGAAGTFQGFRQEFDQLVRQQMERMIGQMNLVSRDEFEAVKAVAANAKLEVEQLNSRISTLEAELTKIRT